MTFGSLFAGIGGMDLGLERAGWECRWQVEIDDYCRRVLTKHWPDVPKYGDIRSVNGRDLERVDLICGGFPCQPVSVAGKRRAQADERWLWPEFARIIREVGPRYVFVENVPGLLTTGMGDVLGDLAGLGYDAEWQSIPAAAIGAPHLRWRVWVVAYPEGLRGTLWQAEGERQGRLTGGRPERCDWWSVEPDVGRVANGVPHRVERLRGLGNAVVPQCAEYVGRLIRADYENTPRRP